MKRVSLLVGIVVFFVSLFISALVAEVADKVIVYYFYTNYRCPTCLKLEQYTKEAVEQYFSEEIKTGTVEFRAINTDEKENSHFTKHYELYTKSVVLSLVKDGKEQEYKNLPKIWEHVGDKGQFLTYIQAETDAYLAELKE